MSIKIVIGQCSSKIISASTGAEYGHVHSNPFSNCQISCYGAFCNLISNTNSLKERQDILQEIHNKALGKSELIIDVTSSYAKQVEDLFKPEEIIFKQPYVNNTKSEMIIYLLQITTMLGRVRAEREAEAALKAKEVVNPEKLKNDLASKQTVSRSKQPF